MDFAAIKMAKDDDLQSIGLSRKGDVLALRAFAEKNGEPNSAERDEKKRKLLETLKAKLPRKKSKSKTKVDKMPNAKEDPKLTHRKITIGWQNFDKERNRYVSVRLSKGGGSRDISVPIHSTKTDIIEQMKLVFFPNGKSGFGYASRMKMSLGNFKFEEITEEDFTLLNYIKCHKLSKVRLYLLTKSVDDIENIFESSGSEEELLSVFDERGHPSSLIGSLSERSNLRQQQDVEYLQSLTKDKEKDEEKRKELESIQDKVKKEQDLYNARLAKVVHEPDIDEPHVTVSVRHLTLGLQTRRFPVSCLISNIYDWVASLSLYPTYFTLSSCYMSSLDPSLPITFD